jgi:tetratricopeptide (TPR) repeat protein
MMSRGRLVLMLLIAALALAGISAGCANNSDTTTTSQTTTTSENTVVSGGKTKDEYRAEIPELEKAVAADPSDLTSLEKLAVAHYQLKEYDQAAEAYLKILAQVDDAFTYNNLGNVYRDQKKLDQAIAQYLKAIELDPTLKQPYINLARVYKENDQMDKAIAILEQAKKALNPTDVESVTKYEDAMTSTTTTT